MTTQTERILKLEERVASLEKTNEKLAVMLEDLWRTVKQIDGDITPFRRIGPGLLPKDLEVK